MRNPFISIILPMHNEEGNVKTCVGEVKKTATALGNPYEIIIAEDGSEDRTYGIAKAIARNDAAVRLMHSRMKLGRGSALKRAFAVARGDVIVYMDADLATELTYLKKAIDEISAGAAIATGSRLLDGSRVQRPLIRDVASRGFNFLVRLLLGSRIHDHQCGFKAFDKKKVMPLLKEIRDNHWFWDTEILVRAQWDGMPISEFPVRWKHGRKTTVRLQGDIAYMAGRIFGMCMERLLRVKGVVE